ncbi:MAG TPA: ATP-binding protein [Fibrobacteraceae bacterium]|nr:ATP-binding protein [Fibrobacteraceae bacterium]
MEFDLQSKNKRSDVSKILQGLQENPIVGILGPRQCGKSTLAKMVLADIPDSLYLDLERPSDLAKLSDPELFLRHAGQRLVCLDEIQRKPELFPLLRSLVDESDRNGQFLVLGSASPDLLKQGSETLAGRIAFVELGPFSAEEWEGPIEALWVQGGFPRSILKGAEASFRWRQEFVSTFLERDLANLGFPFPAETLRRLWRMLAYAQGGLLNHSRIGESLGVSHTTIRRYIDALSGTFMVRQLEPWAGTSGRRLIRAPKVFVRDSGIVHALLGLRKYEDLLGWPQCGASWEGFVLDQLWMVGKGWDFRFYRDSGGSEIDIVMQKGLRTLAVECKLSAAPKVERGFWSACEQVKPDTRWIIAPVQEAYPYREDVEALPIREAMRRLRDM